MPHWKSLIVTTGIAVAIRIILSGSAIKEFLVDRVEVSTPANSFKRTMEGIALERKGISPYSGDIFHEMPLMLYGARVLMSNWQAFFPLILSILDVTCAVFLGRAVFHYVTFLKSEKLQHDDDPRMKLILPGDPDRIYLLVQICYLFNPLIVASCVAQTSSVFHNLFLAVALWGLATNRRIPCLFSLALASYQGLYPLILSVPVALKFAQKIARGKRSVWSLEFFQSFGIFFAIWGSLLYMSSVLFGSWSFLDSTYGFLVSVPDLTPNVGLFWYFFTEMFDHFRLFFLWVFQVNLIVYLVPLALCLRDDPFLLFNEFLMLIAVFKSYPSVADAGLYLALFPAWRHLFHYLRHGFVVGCAIACCTALAPVMWFLWIHAGAANANFYFAITLVYSTAQIFLLTDILYAHLRRQIHLKHGMEPNIKGKKAKIVLQ